MLTDREVEWRLSRVIWLENGGENTNFFHPFANHKKKKNMGNEG
jgi:hypothetical protein